MNLTVKIATLVCVLAALPGCSGDEGGHALPTTSLASGVAVVSGLISDAQTGAPISGAIVILGGTATFSDTTGASGYYDIFHVPAGTYTVTVSYAGYITTSTPVTVEPTSDPVTVFRHVAISAELSANRYRFVLTWDDEPDDLDLHLWTGEYHIYYNQRGDSLAAPWSTLDLDGREGAGPETLTVRSLTADCRLAVRNYTGGDAAQLAGAGVHVDVYGGAERLASYDISPSGSGYWWYVCDLTADGVIITRDLLSDNEPTFPASL